MDATGSQLGTSSSKVSRSLGSWFQWQWFDRCCPLGWLVALQLASPSLIKAKTNSFHKKRFYSTSSRVIRNKTLPEAQRTQGIESILKSSEQQKHVESTLLTWSSLFDLLIAFEYLKKFKKYLHTWHWLRIALYWHHQFYWVGIIISKVSTKGPIRTDLETPRTIDRTPGTPGSGKNTSAIFYEGMSNIYHQLTFLLKTWRLV